MQTTTRLAPGNIRTLASSWRLSLEAENKSTATLETYGISLRQFIAFLIDRGMPTEVEHIRREHVEAFIAYLLERWKPTTASVRYRALSAFWRWAVEDGEVTESPMARMKPPILPESPSPVPRDEDVRALLATCAGQTFEDRRDRAMFLALADTGMRVGELCGMILGDVDLERRELHVVGKGRRGRVLPLGTAAARALDRYIRVRSRHPQADYRWLWIGRRGRVTTSGVRQILETRCKQASIAPNKPASVDLEARYQSRSEMPHGPMHRDGPPGVAPGSSLEGAQSRAQQWGRIPVNRSEGPAPISWTRHEAVPVHVGPLRALRCLPGIPRPVRPLRRERRVTTAVGPEVAALPARRK